MAIRLKRTHLYILYYISLHFDLARIREAEERKAAGAAAAKEQADLARIREERYAVLACMREERKAEERKAAAAAKEQADLARIREERGAVLALM